MNRLKELPEHERPYEKAAAYGVSALTDAELLAVVLRTGTKNCDVLTLSSRILQLGDRDQGLCGLMHHTREEYASCAGIGSVKAVQLSALGEIAKRIWRREREENAPSFSLPSACAEYYMEELRHLEQEELHAVFLDARMRRIGDRVISRGTVDSSVFSVRDVLIAALRAGAVQMILIHNHPSGDPSPSAEDSAVTEQVRQAGELTGIRLADHIIIGDTTYYSFKEWGIL